MTPYKDKEEKRTYQRLYQQKYREKLKRQKRERINQRAENIAERQQAQNPQTIEQVEKPTVVEQPIKEPEEKPIPSAKKAQLENFQRLGKTPTVEEAKRKLVAEIRYWNTVKKDDTYMRSYRLKAEDESFRAYERLLLLCDGDSDTVQRLLYRRSKASWDNEYREDFEEKLKKETEE